MYSTNSGLCGAPLIFTKNTVQADIPLGTIVQASDPFFGVGEFIYLKAAGTITRGNLVVWDLSNFATACPNTPNMARSVGVALDTLASGDYAWFQISGQAIVSTTASVAAGTSFGITGAGTVGAITAGKQILNAVSAAPGTTTAVKTAQTVNGSPIIKVNNTNGWFPGITLTGTGVSGTVTSIAADGLSVVASANASATNAGVSVTGTYTGFIQASIDRPFAQGAIT